MAAAAIMKEMISGTRKYVINVTGVWDTADEVDTVIIDRSTLTGPDGSAIPGRIRIDEITWAVSVGFNSVLLSWDDTADENVDYYSGQGYMDYLNPTKSCIALKMNGQFKAIKRHHPGQKL